MASQPSTAHMKGDGQWSTASLGRRTWRFRRWAWAACACPARRGASTMKSQWPRFTWPFDLGINFLDTSASYGNGHNHELIARALKGRRERVVVHSKTGSPRTPDPSGIRGGGSPEYLARVCEDSLRRRLHVDGPHHGRHPRLGATGDFGEQLGHEVGTASLPGRASEHRSYSLSAAERTSSSQAGKSPTAVCRITEPKSMPTCP